ncbi:hypothetical protein CsSME_00051966 [Camellia sinensis var. sinensis]
MGLRRSLFCLPSACINVAETNLKHSSLYDSPLGELSPIVSNSSLQKMAFEATIMFLTKFSHLGAHVIKGLTGVRLTV